MAINRLIASSGFETEVLNRALAYTLRKIGLVDRNDPITEMIARKVIEIGHTGIHDPVQISKIAVSQLRLHYGRRADASCEPSPAGTAAVEAIGKAVATTIAGRAVLTQGQVDDRSKGDMVE